VVIRENLDLRRRRRSSVPTSPSSRQAHIMRLSPTGRTERTIFSMRSTHSSLTTRYPSMVDRRTKTISRNVKRKS
jgi:hypothetical protein